MESTGIPRMQLEPLRAVEGFGWVVLLVCELVGVAGHAFPPPLVVLLWNCVTGVVTFDSFAPRPRRLSKMSTFIFTNNVLLVGGYGWYIAYALHREGNAVRMVLTVLMASVLGLLNAVYAVLGVWLEPPAGAAKGGAGRLAREWADEGAEAKLPQRPQRARASGKQ